MLETPARMTLRVGASLNVLPWMLHLPQPEPALSDFRLLLEGVGRSGCTTCTGLGRARAATKRTPWPGLLVPRGHRKEDWLGNNYGRERLQIELGHCCFKHLLVIHNRVFPCEKGQLFRRKICFLAEASEPREMV